MDKDEERGRGGAGQVDSLVPGEWFVEEVSQGGAEILVAECSHAAKSASSSLRITNK